ncbi:unnamed protein product [Parnassius apollo]|uniref:(apollo) hypothetical protein n=1 Tax=Parnassius apollo TaxID=110799 RepID=A0A8S3WAQ6_PARAO|nr:unnamed protein product [Parnassius apollo]
MNANAQRAYFRAKGEETGCLAYRARTHRLFAELEPSLTVTEQNLAEHVRYILRSNIFDVAELERLRCEAVPSVVVDSNDDGTVAQELELEHMSTLEVAIVETRSTLLENRPRLPRIALRKRNRAVVRALNPMLVTYLEASRDLCETDSILFGAALAACRIIGAKVSAAGRATGQNSAIPAWRRTIEERIAKARALIGRMICFRSGNNRPRIVRTVRMAFAGTNVSLSQPDITQKLTECIDDLKQRIAAWGRRIRRYTERSTRFNQNRLFQSDQKRLYESLERPMVSGTGAAPNQADTIEFWRGLWSEPVNHSEGPWTEVVASQCASMTPMDPVIITPIVAEAVRRAPNWKSPGLDGLHHYWLKGFVVFMACVFGGDTLMELRQALQLAETERKGGMSPHISPFTRIRDIGGLLNAAGFTLQTVDVEALTIWYPSAWHLMRDVRTLGESNAALNRPLHLDRDVQFAAAAIYDEMYGKDFPEKNSRGVPATFQIINFLGWKPDPSQPKPLEKGTGEVSLKDLHKIDEIIKDTNKVKLSEEDMK